MSELDGFNSQVLKSGPLWPQQLLAQHPPVRLTALANAAQGQHFSFGKGDGVCSGNYDRLLTRLPRAAFYRQISSEFTKQKLFE